MKSSLPFSFPNSLSGTHLSRKLQFPSARVSKRTFIALLGLFVATAAPLKSEVVRLAPEFAVESFNGTSKPASRFGKQPLILIIAPSPKSGVFKKQLKHIENLYRQYAGREALFIAAFTRETGTVESDIPFLYATDPQAVAASYGLGREKFQLNLIGPDHNLDLVTSEIVSGERIRDVIDNSYTRQSVRRR
ncbi:MAG TPA: DUF4174 domain-containing protein [Chthoniobacterales bacterium]|jgi:hypothetical protein